MPGVKNIKLITYIFNSINIVYYELLFINNYLYPKVPKSPSHAIKGVGIGYTLLKFCFHALIELSTD